jgi:Uma2 family endonuclease
LGETPLHASVIVNILHMLVDWFARDPTTYVWGNMMMYYVPGDKWKHVSPDVFVVRGVPRDKYRECYLTWEEGKGPDLVVEVTSRSTRNEDVREKMRLYRDVLKVSEYFLFDPKAEHLNPPLQGYRLKENQYLPIEPIEDRLPSEVVSLHFEADGSELRLWDPVGGKRLLTRQESLAAATAQLQQADVRSQQDQARLQQADAEIAELRRQLDSFRQRLSEP